MKTNLFLLIATLLLIGASSCGKKASSDADNDYVDSAEVAVDVVEETTNTDVNPIQKYRSLSKKENLTYRVHDGEGYLYFSLESYNDLPEDAREFVKLNSSIYLNDNGYEFAISANVGSDENGSEKVTWETAMQLSYGQLPDKYQADVIAKNAKKIERMIAVIGGSQPDASIWTSVSTSGNEANVVSFKTESVTWALKSVEHCYRIIWTEE